MKNKLESLFVDVTNDNGTVVEGLADQIKKAMEKYKSITKIEGEEIEIYELALRGIREVEEIDITYGTRDNRKTKEYSLEEFYNL